MTEEQIDVQIPGHRILSRLGTGGMAHVYLAFQESMEREVALKLMHRSLGETDKTFGERFVREAKIVAKLTHPHINAVYDVGISGPYHYFTMEYLKGGDLKSRIRRGMPPRAVLEIVRQITSALAFAHSKGYVHRDVKPENVLFRDSGTAVLTDFGIAKANDNSMTATGTVIGTPYYMSPEQAMGRPTDNRSDLYSLGAMTYEMLTGKVPYDGDSAISIGIKHLKDPLPQLPPPLQLYQALLDRFLAKNPDHRFQTGEEAIAAIDALAAKSLSAATTSGGVDRTVILSPTASTKSKRSARPAVLVGATLLAVIVGGVVVVKMRKAQQVPAVASAPATIQTTEPAPAIEATPTSPAQNESAARAAQIEQLLTEAQAAARAEQFFTPVETAAVPKLQRVLELDPGNATAARALNTIAGRLIAAAERSVETKDFEQAEKLLHLAEQADSGHPLLFSRRLALRELRQTSRAGAPPAARAARNVEGRQTARAQPTRAAPVAAQPTTTVAAVEDPVVRQNREREKKLQGLLTRFQDLVAPNAVSATRAGLAREVVVEATRLAPDDGRVRTLPNQLADAYLKLATAKVEEKEYQEANALIERGLELRPDHRMLLSLQKDVSEKTTKKRQTFGSF